MSELRVLPGYLDAAGFKNELARDCKAVSRFYQLFLEVEGSNMDTILDFMKDWTVPESTNATTDVDYLTSWKEIASKANLAAETGVEPQFYNCNITICQGLKFSGNPDIGGVGMVVASCIQAAIALVIMITLSVHYYHYRRKDRDLPPLHESGPKQKKFGHKVLVTVRGITLDFLDTSAYYNMAITMVGTVIAAKKESSAYDVSTAFFISFMSVWAYYCIMPFHKDVQDGRRSIFRSTGLIITTGFAIAQFVLTGKKLFRGKRGDALNFLPVKNWDDFCYKEATVGIFEGSFIVAALAFVGVFLILTIINYSMKWCRKKVDVIPPRIACSIASGVAYILSVLFFFVYQYAVREYVDEDFEEREWGYGQYLALFTWIPLLLEFFYIYFFGIAKAKEGKLPFPYNVIFFEEKTDDIGQRLASLIKPGKEKDSSSEIDDDQANQKTPMLTVRPDLPHGFSSQSTSTMNSGYAVSTSYAPPNTQNTQYNSHYAGQYPNQSSGGYQNDAGQFPNQNSGGYYQNANQHSNQYPGA